MASAKSPPPHRRARGWWDLNADTSLIGLNSDVQLLGCAIGLQPQSRQLPQSLRHKLIYAGLPVVGPISASRNVEIVQLRHNYTPIRIPHALFVIASPGGHCSFRRLQIVWNSSQHGVEQATRNRTLRTSNSAQHILSWLALPADLPPRHRCLSLLSLSGSQIPGCDELLKRW